MSSTRTSGTVLVIALATALHLDVAPRPARAQDAGSPSPRDDRPEEARKRGLVLNTDAAFNGYTLFAPLQSTTTYLVDMKGELVHSWPSEYQPGQAVYLLNDGALLRCAREPNNRHFRGGGIGGRVERIGPDGKVEWEFVYADENHCQHHDIEPLPNGHILMIAWEKKSRDDALAAGRNSDEMKGDEFWPDCVIEVVPHGLDQSEIVWEWHTWDHLVQGIDAKKPNYGVPAEHPELIDLNARGFAPRETPAEMRRLRQMGYVGGGEDEDDDDKHDGQEKRGDGADRKRNDNDSGNASRSPDGNQDDGQRRRAEDPGRRPGMGRGPGGPEMQADWLHTNAIDYNAKLDQIALSIHNLNEVWIIDHSTSTNEAVGHSGGKSGKGGDLLYRWGNPRVYAAGTAKDQQLFAQHDVRWISPGCPGAGHLLVFNNGEGRQGERYSTITEIAPPIDASGHYKLEKGKAFGPTKPAWEYAAENHQDFYASHISGAERQPNGNTVICNGEEGRVFEVTASGKVVWEYWNPYLERSGPTDGPMGFGGGPPGDGGADGPRLRPGGPDGGPPGGRRIMRGGPGGLFRASRLAADHPGVKRVLSEEQQAISTTSK